MKRASLFSSRVATSANRAAMVLLYSVLACGAESSDSDGASAASDTAGTPSEGAGSPASPGDDEPSAGTPPAPSDAAPSGDGAGDTPASNTPGTPAPDPGSAPSEGAAPGAVDVGMLGETSPGTGGSGDSDSGDSDSGDSNSGDSNSGDSDSGDSDSGDTGSSAGPSGGDTDAPQTCNIGGAATAATPSIWVVGDSTASVYASNLYPRTGWAQPLQQYYAAACATTNDRALSGRSSKSFIDEGAWAPVRDALRPGDFVLIQFGHNDEKSDDPLRFTDPATTFRDYLSIYIDDALAHDATPVLLTPIQRNNWDGTTLRETHGAYPDAIRQLAQARNVALVDATALTTEYLERIGPAASTELFMNLAVGQFPNYPDGNGDNTHLREEGAHAVARLILADLARQGSAVGRLVMSVPVAP